jgi:phage terminase small subunit
MKTLKETNIDIGAEAAKPLKNLRWENFCQNYAGKAWGCGAKAYLMAGYSPKDNKAASDYAGQLLKKPLIMTRIDKIRQEKLESLKIDSLWIAEQRKKIIEESDKNSDRLRALNDLERGLGLLPPDRVKIENNAEIKLVFEGKDDQTC